jgi:hypothetical protein
VGTLNYINRKKKKQPSIREEKKNCRKKKLVSKFLISLPF